MIPSDPIMLLSFINMKLRDFYPSLTALCEELELSEDELRKKMHTIGYEYDESANRFV